jgi:hypothetical protein
VILLVSLSAPLGNVIAGPFGDFMILVGGCSTIGTAITGGVGLWAGRRARRRPAISPWATPRSVDLQPYLTLGLLVGGSIGFALWIVDSYFL